MSKINSYDQKNIYTFKFLDENRIFFLITRRYSLPSNYISFFEFRTFIKWKRISRTYKLSTSKGAFSRRELSRCEDVTFWPVGPRKIMLFANFPRSYSRGFML